MHFVSLSIRPGTYHRLTYPFEAVESRSGCIYCRLCNDFVYDPEFEKLRIQHAFFTSKLPDMQDLTLLTAFDRREET